MCFDYKRAMNPNRKFPLLRWHKDLVAALHSGYVEHTHTHTRKKYTLGLLWVKCEKMHSNLVRKTGERGRLYLLPIAYRSFARWLIASAKPFIDTHTHTLSVLAYQLEWLLTLQTFYLTIVGDCFPPHSFVCARERARAMFCSTRSPLYSYSGRASYAFNIAGPFGMIYITETLIFLWTRAGKWDFCGS